MRGATHSRNMSGHYLHTQFLETPTHVDSPSILKSILSIVI